MLCRLCMYAKGIIVALLSAPLKQRVRSGNLGLIIEEERFRI